MWVWRRLRFAPLRRRKGSGVCGEGNEPGLGKMAREWHFTLRERQASTRMSFPPRRQLKMSHDVKYIGMDVPKEAIVIAVLKCNRLP
jgi:hypothetical protein